LVAIRFTDQFDESNADASAFPGVDDLVREFVPLD
jgi:hypothetical protein